MIIHNKILAIPRYMTTFLLLVSFIFFNLSKAADGEEYRNEIKRLKTNLTNSFLTSSAESIFHTANEALKTINDEGGWDDVDYSLLHTPLPGGIWALSPHMNRLVDMSKGYAKQGQRLYKAPELKAALEKSLAYTEKNVFNEDGKRFTRAQQQGLWWYWNFGVPMNMGQVLILLEGEIDNDIYEEFQKSIKWFLSNPFDWDLNGLVGNAGNSMWAAKANLFYYASEGNHQALSYIVEQVAKNYRIFNPPQEGIMEDMSFRAHWMIDFSGYYPTFISEPLTFIGKYLVGTQYQLPQESIDVLASNLYEGALWSLWNGYVDIGVRGRALDGPFKKASHISNAVGVFADIENIYREEFKRVEGDFKAGRQLKRGHKHFWMSDFSAHHNDGWYASLRMNSSRNIASEAFGGRGVTTDFYSDGALWVQLEDEYFSGGAFAALDWDMLPGTTVVRSDKPFRYYSYIMGSEGFVGGCYTDKYGVSAMQLGKVSTPLRAKKSWFFFDDEIVCLGSDISNNGKGLVETIINQRPVKDTDLLPYVDGNQVSITGGEQKTLEEPKWAWHSQIGYYFPYEQNVELQLKNQSGSWKDLSAGMSEAVHNVDFMTLWYEHGEGISSGKYAYSILPAMTNEQTAAYSKGKPFEILEQSQRIHAVKDRSTNAVGAVFWKQHTDYATVHLDLPYAGRVFYDDGMISRTHPHLLPATAEIDGIKGVANNKADQNLYFAVSGQRVSPSDARLIIKWYDAPDAQEGANFKIAYNSSTGKRHSKTVPYRFSGKWVETTLLLEDTDFNDFYAGGINLEVEHSRSPIDVQVDEGSTYGAENSAYGVLVNRIYIEPVRRNPANRGGQDFEIDIVKVSHPCILFYQLQDNLFTITLSNPTFERQQISVEIDLPLQPANLPSEVSVVDKGNQTLLTFDTDYGRNYKAVFTVDTSQE